MSQNYQQSIQSAPAQNAQENTQDMIAGLKQLKELVDEGILTEEEFSAKKKQVLGL
ncbi:SHOCT domain-containing protein [Lactobacillus helsingborgensis]|uniref:SHOCT domain-containing protein n=1 Tax=Lactobacillus helsingborgensis TaxID=1218494 RepID=UPI00164FFFB7|nr:SHOCT domain-containing protein [Lactobacillus helsingborgensis]MBC6357263.1 SHOCT domain-containing protein [Lactobacillus helsingborgensis]